MEDDADTLFSAWKTSPSPAGLSKIVNALSPTIDYSLSSIGAADDPTIRTKARALTAKAVTGYDPSHGTKLSSWVASQLRPLTRYKRKTQGIGLPERTQLDAWQIHKGTQEFLDKHGREPDTTELADYLRMPVKRIAAVRRASGRSVVSEEQTGAESGDDFVDEAVSYLLPELDHVGRKILEHRTGYAGADIRDAARLAAELGVSPPTVSRKAAYLHTRLQDVMDKLKETYE